MNLNSDLLQLEHASLVRRLDELDPTYAFKHTLTQETAYDSLLRTRRAELHRKVAEAIEALFPDQLEQNAAMLALHYAQAGIETKAFTYALAAGDLARRAYAHQEALEFYDRALALADGLRDPSLRAQVRRVYAQRGKVFEVRGDFDDALENYRQMIAYAQRVHDLTMEAEGAGLLLSTESVLGDVSDAEPRFEQAIDLARRAGDQELVGRAYWSFGLSLRFKDPTRALQYLNQALEVARVANLRELAAFALVDIVIAMQFMGQWERIVEYSQQALAEFRALDNRSMIANCLGMLSEGYRARGDPELARRSAEEGVHVSEAIENPWGIGYNTWSLMIIDTEAGRLDQAVAQIKTFEAVRAKIPIPMFAGLINLTLALVYFEVDQLDRALALASDASEALKKLESPTLFLWGRGMMGRILVRQRKLEEGFRELEPVRRSLPDIATNLWALVTVAPVALESCLIDARCEETLRLTSKLLDPVIIEPLQAYAAESIYLRGVIYLRLGDWRQAGIHLDRARAIATRAANNMLLWHIDGASAQLYAKRGEQDQAESMRVRAVQRVQEIAGNIGDPILRASFLRRQDIQELLSA